MSTLAQRVVARYSSNALPEGLDGFDLDEPQSVDALEEARTTILHKLGESPSQHEARRYIKPAGLRGVVGDAIGFFQRKRAWMLLADADSKSEATQIGLRAQKNLTGKKSLTASDPYIYTWTLYVAFRGGFVEIDGLPEQEKDTAKSDLKHKILYKGKQTFGASGVKFTGHEGAYVLEVLPVLREFRGKFSPTKIPGKTLEEIDSRLDEVIAKVQALLGH